MRVLIAPDSFKGSAAAAGVADALRAGWLEIRPDDHVDVLPLADGGEGTLEAIAASARSAWHNTPVDGPAGGLDAPWLLLPGGVAVVELAVACGLPLWPRPDPMGAHTHALGQVLRAVAGRADVERTVVALGGSASTDGGAGALAALGARFVLDDGARMPLGAAGLERLGAVDFGDLVQPPRGGVALLVDVDAPLLGDGGAAAQFGPQKGATGDDVERLERGLSRLSALLRGRPGEPGSGAAGGTAYGLSAAWGATLQPGSRTVADLVGLGDALRSADLVVTGEGRLDPQSLRGKVVGHVIESARQADVAVWACVGVADAEVARELGRCIELTRLAGSTRQAIARPERWLREAGRVLAGAV